MKQSKERKLAIKYLNDYIDFLIENKDAPSIDGTDGWILSLDQYAAKAAQVERDLIEKRNN